MIWQTMSPDGQTLHHLLGRCKSITSLTLNYLRLLDHSLCHFLTLSIQQLNLWCCSSLSYQILASIGNNCPNLRVLVLELADKDSPDVFRIGRNRLETDNLSVPTSPPYIPKFGLQSLSLVLDLISDELLESITDYLPLLVELDLEDRTYKVPLPGRDFTNTGIQFVGSCRRLTALSLVRDLAFHDLTGVVSCALVEVRLLSCRLITSETVEKRALCRSLEILDLGDCKSIADSCLSSISHLQKLTALNFSGADITDSGLYALEQGSLSITNLCLRGCKRVTDKGVTRFLCGRGTIGKRLTTLDLGYMPGISDETILAVAAADIGIIDLCIRSCFYVTDSSVEALAKKRSVQGMNKQPWRLDLCNCISLSAESLRWLKKPSFTRNDHG
ncbi:hypothetical protein LWI28_018541 [Acer negundo]|uniref:F-box/LRR-repeat protein 15-like leucin rich repeat domain-containing protein n=1 Tax=Acer negundo TaxID=4023 RepID=A0AAD5NXR5_ACENE|nr:hypothetical protein LWI28_018541 [Acer negundo]